MILAKKILSGEIKLGEKVIDYNFAIQEELQVGYDDITSIVNWDRYWEFLEKDYKFIRYQIMELVWIKMWGDPAYWDNLTLEEKQVASRWFVVPKELRDTVYSTEEQIPQAETFDKESIKAREIRYNKAKYEIYNRLTIEQANTILNEIENSISIVTPNLRDKYIIYGREGTLETDPEGLFDYLCSREGTSFEDYGFKDHDYIPIGYDSMTDLVDTKLMYIFRDGNY